MIVVAPSAASSVAGVTVLLNFDEQHFEREAAMWVYSREMDQLIEDIEERALFRAAAARDDAPTCAAELNEMLTNDNRLDDEYVVLFDERGNFVPNRRKGCELDFDELFVADDVDAVSADALFGEASS